MKTFDEFWNEYGSRNGIIASPDDYTSAKDAWEACEKEHEQKITELRRDVSVLTDINESLNQKVIALEARVKEADEVIAFYAASITWQKYSSLGGEAMPARSEEDRESDFHVPGKRAREHQAKYKQTPPSK